MPAKPTAAEQRLQQYIEADDGPLTIDCKLFLHRTAGGRYEVRAQMGDAAAMVISSKAHQRKGAAEEELQALQALQRRLIRKTSKPAEPAPAKPADTPTPAAEITTDVLVAAVRDVVAKATDKPDLLKHQPYVRGGWVHVHVDSLLALPALKGNTKPQVRAALRDNGWAQAPYRPEAKVPGYWRTQALDTYVPEGTPVEPAPATKPRGTGGRAAALDTGALSKASEIPQYPDGSDADKTRLRTLWDRYNQARTNWQQTCLRGSQVPAKDKAAKDAAREAEKAAKAKSQEAQQELLAHRKMMHAKNTGDDTAAAAQRVIDGDTTFEQEAAAILA